MSAIPIAPRAACLMAFCPFFAIYAQDNTDRRLQAVRQPVMYNAAPSSIMSNITGFDKGCPGLPAPDGHEAHKFGDQSKLDSHLNSGIGEKVLNPQGVLCPSQGPYHQERDNEYTQLHVQGALSSGSVQSGRNHMVADFMELLEKFFLCSVFVPNVHHIQNTKFLESWYAVTFDVRWAISALEGVIQIVLVVMSENDASDVVVHSSNDVDYICKAAFLAKRWRAADSAGQHSPATASIPVL
ncbi:hypothetical protein F5877DRAFT_65232 [Lentinula edodes]|nr:hypothetical protein F5877DRAFT_65232 [Lentinula edodes]